MSKHTPSFRMPLILHLWSKGLMPIGFGAKAGDYPEHMAGDMAYEKPDTPAYQTDDFGLNDSTAHLPLDGESVASVETVESLRSVESIESTPLPEYLTAVWERAKASKPLAADGYVLQMRDLVALCFELQTLAKDGTFYLACRHVGALLGIDFRKASKMLHKLERDKIIERVSTGKVKMRPGQKVKANEYRYLGG